MNKLLRIPFKNLDFEAWMRLAITALVAFYIVRVGFIFINKELFRPVGLDFLGFWSAGSVASQFNYSQIYNLQLLKTIQVQQLSNLGVSVLGFSTVPPSLISFFIIPFQLLSFLNLKTSFEVWTIINLIALIFYLAFFTSKIVGGITLKTFPTRILIYMLLSYPIYQNLYWGQVEVFLLICSGEFIRNALLKKPIASGLWLGGLLIKPQVLILVVPALFLMKNWRILVGFVFSSLIISGSSFIISGISGMQGMLRLWLSYLPGIATNSPEAMANWRMLGIHLSTLISPFIGWAIAIFGMLASLIIWYFLWRRKPVFGSVQWVTMMGGIFSISCAFTWHSHIHMMMVVIPYIVFCSVKNIISSWIYELWVFMFPGVAILIFIAAALLSIVTTTFYNFGELIFGTTGLALSIFFTLMMLKNMDFQIQN